MAQSFFIVDLPNGKMVIFHSYENVYQRVIYQLDQGLSRILVWQHFRRLWTRQSQEWVILNLKSSIFRGESFRAIAIWKDFMLWMHHFSCFDCLNPFHCYKYTMMWFGSRYWSDQHLTNLRVPSGV